MQDMSKKNTCTISEISVFKCKHVERIFNVALKETLNLECLKYKKKIQLKKRYALKKKL